MGRTYYAMSEEAKGRFGKSNFDVNISGAQILGMLHKKLGLPLHASIFSNHDTPDTPFAMDAADAKDTAQKLAAIPDEEIAAAMPDKLFDGTPYEFVEFVRSWQAFLETCEGYDV